MDYSAMTSEYIKHSVLAAKYLRINACPFTFQQYSSNIEAT
ncbi:MAG TPA: hypothetical protein PLX69_07100 [Leptospiraceae bacterium]|nr:hypothetical protein [Leptospiraceae bacterium]HRG74307.1 hypothetical protein [Leptospiraceae bacterium]